MKSIPAQRATPGDIAIIIIYSMTLFAIITFSGLTSALLGDYDGRTQCLIMILLLIPLIVQGYYETRPLRQIGPQQSIKFVASFRRYFLLICSGIVIQSVIVSILGLDIGHDTLIAVMILIVYIGVIVPAHKLKQQIKDEVQNGISC